MNEETLLLRYLDGELSPDEVVAFRMQLARSPELRRQLAELEQVGSLVRAWAAQAGRRAGPLLEPTLQRIELAEQKRRRYAGRAVAVAALLLLLLPASARDPFVSRAPSAVTTSVRAEPAAAIERLEAPDRHAQVFVVGSSGTPVVWLVDEAEDASDQDPG